MKRILLDLSEKRLAFNAFQVWKRTGIRRPDIEAFTRTSGVAAIDAYTTFLHLDTLYALRDEAPLVWKGGTAIQTLVPPEVQRISTDLDFNATIHHPEVIRDAVTKINKRLENDGHIIRLHDVPYGALYETDHRPWHQTIEFRRILPSPFDETIDIQPKKLGWSTEPHIRIPGRLERLQINYGHADLPALHLETTEVSFFTQPAFQPETPVTTTRASIHDLTADKVLATTKHDGFGRQRFKDAYDLTILRTTGNVHLETVREKLERIVTRTHLKTVVEGSLTTLDHFSQESAAAQGFRTMVCNQGKKIIDQWPTQMDETSQWLQRLL